MKKSESPYAAHLFICSKTRENGRKSCGNDRDPDLKSILKDAVRERGWKPMVRVSDSSCLGLCESGPNILIHPHKIWLSDVSVNDVPEILQTLEDILEG